MPVFTVYQHGLKAGVAPAPSDHERAKRDKVKGWTAKSARSNLAFLQSVVIDRLDGIGHCITLTVKDCPESAKVWDAMRNAYVKRLTRAGMLRFHWVTEWQERGVPHLHGVAYFPEPESDAEYMAQDRVLRHGWLAIVKKYRATENGQKIVDIEDRLGWLKYLAKHAARGATHYQRSSESIPAGWKGQTGRMWGRAGTWPTAKGIQYDLTPRGFFEMRRAIQRWRLADARSFQNAKRIRSARKLLQCNVRTLSEVRGVSEWMPMEYQNVLLTWIASMGHAVRLRSEKDPEVKDAKNENDVLADPVKMLTRKEIMAYTRKNSRTYWNTEQ